MKAKLTMCVGLPGSGKTTWALGQDNTSRINQDDIRKELGWTSWTAWDFKGPLETLTHTLKRERIATALGMGFHVISDDTNLGGKREQEMKMLAVKKNPKKMGPTEALNWRQKKYTEAIQVAAMAVRFAAEVC